MQTSFDSLLDGLASPSAFDPTTLLAPLLPFLIGTLVLGALFLVLYTVQIINTQRTQRAVREMRDLLREMNDRQKTSTLPSDNSLQPPK